MTVTGEGQWLRPPSSSPSAAFSACRIYLASFINPAGNLSVIPFDTSDLDTDGYADLASNRIEIPTGFGGWFDVRLRLGITPDASMSTGRAEAFIKTLAAGIRESEHKSWNYLTYLVGTEAAYRIDWTADLADGEILYAAWQNSTDAGVFIQGGNGSGAPAPESYLQVVRLGDD